MAYAYKAGGRWQEITGPFAIGEGEARIQYPADWPERAPIESARLGIVRVEESEAPADVQLLRSDLAGNVVPRRVWVTEPYPIAEARARRWAAAKLVREARAEGGCMTPLGRADTDPDGQRKVNGAVTGALIAQAAGAPYGIDWTMSDNSIVSHDGPAMIMLGMAVLSHIDACQTAGSAIRAAIEAATDVAAVAAVDIEAGYP